MSHEVDIHYMLGTPTHCEKCGRPIRRGERTVTDGDHEFCTMNCETEYEEQHPSS